MISSPCKNCSRINLPKEDCINNCRLLRAVQDIELSATAEQIGFSNGIDYAEENRYVISAPIEKQNLYSYIG